MIGHEAALQFARFVSVGALNTGFSYGVYAAMLFAGMHYAAASLTAMAAGTVFSFRTQGSLVFGNRDWRPFGRFLLAWAVIWGCNVVFIAALMRFTGADEYLAGAVAVAPVALLSFVVQKHLVFVPPANGRSGQA